MFKKGLSPVIAIVLLLMITIIAAGIIVGVVVPFTEDNLDESKACFEVLGDLSFAETQFNCFNATDDGGRTGFSIRTDNEDIAGFRVTLGETGSADSFDIEAEATSDIIRMLDTDFNTALSVPRKGGVRTYVARGDFEKIEVFPILTSGAKCGLADEVQIVQCDGPEAIDEVTRY